MIKALLSVLTLSLSTQVWGNPASQYSRAPEDWVQVWHTKGARGYIDGSSLDRSGDVVRFDQLMVLENPDATGAASIRSRTEMDCARSTSRLISFSSHSKDDRPISGFKFPNGGPVEAIESGVSRQIFNFVCHRGGASGEGQLTPSAAESPRSAEAHQCLATVENGSGVKSFRNGCNFAVSFSYCAGQGNCPRRIIHIFVGAYGLSASGFRGEAHWFACRHPARPAGVSYVQGRGLLGRCHT